MSPEENASWSEANQRFLAANVARIRRHLEIFAQNAQVSSAEAADTIDTDALNPAKMSPPAALSVLCAAFRLSPFERDILLLCAGVELDTRLAKLVAGLSGQAGQSNPTFSLALAALPDPHWSALAPGSALRRYRMIELTPGLPLTTGPLKIDERILHYLSGISYPDERLSGLVERFSTQQTMAISHENIVRRIIELCRQAPDISRLPVIALAGPDGGTQKDIAARVCRHLGLHLGVVAAENLPASPADLTALIRLWEREAYLTQSALLIDYHAIDPADKRVEYTAGRFLHRAGGLLFMAAPEKKHLDERQLATFDITLPPAAEQRALWLAALGNRARRLDGQLDAIASQFLLSPGAIRDACEEALAQNPEAPEMSLWNACRKQARPRLEQLACRIEPQASWDDLVLPGSQKEILRAVATHVRLHGRVYETWGFAAKSARGLGISALFAGPSGTGKTLAAEVLAGDLQLDLFRIDLSQVVNKYIGETEKNLKRVFDAAEAGGAILLFDEADALFGKRSEVKDSHDRYANIEVSYLLQRMEAYRGLAILTTNMKEALDTAFLRRIRFIVQFPFPDATQRAEIWRRIFPDRTPTAGLDAQRLSTLQVAGGNIRNIALSAAFIAADTGCPVGMTHIEQAARREYAKIEKSMSAAESAAFRL